MQALVRPSRGSVEGVRQTLASFFGSRDVVLTSSGTAALTLAMRGARRIAGDAPVALPAYGCYDLATAAAGSGSRVVVLYDLDPATLAPDTDSLRAAVSAGVSAAVVVHFYGIPVDLAPLDEVLSGTLVIEDAAQGAGARLRERPLGSSGSLGILSFGRGKGVTCGRGGALLVHDDAGQAILGGLEEPPRAPAGWRDVAVAATLAWLAHPSVYWAPALLPFLHLGETVYKEPSPPGPVSRAAGALLAHTWQLVEAEATVRRENADRLQRAVQLGNAFAIVPVPAEARPGYVRLPVLARRRGIRTARLRAGRHMGIAPGYPGPLSALEQLAERCENTNREFRGAQELCDRLVTLPVHRLLDERDLTMVERWIAMEE
jgi:dTDP-4-amino-4,6-dideoxygalactose transaminase